MEYHQNDSFIRWPLTLAPYLCVVIPIYFENATDAEDFAKAIQKWSPAIGTPIVGNGWEFLILFS